MIDLSNILSSKSRFLILKILSAFHTPVPLRHFEALTGLSIGSVQITLRGLVKQGVVLKKKRGRLMLHKLNERHPQIPMIHKIFELISSEVIREKSGSLSQRAIYSLNLSEEINKFLRNAYRT